MTDTFSRAQSVFMMRTMVHKHMYFSSTTFYLSGGGGGRLGRGFRGVQSKQLAAVGDIQTTFNPTAECPQFTRSLLMHSQTEWKRTSWRGGPALAPQQQSELLVNNQCWVWTRLAVSVAFPGLVWESLPGDSHPSANPLFRFSCRSSLCWDCSTVRPRKR